MTTLCSIFVNFSRVYKSQYVFLSVGCRLLDNPRRVTCESRRYACISDGPKVTRCRKHDGPWPTEKLLTIRTFRNTSVAKHWLVAFFRSVRKATETTRKEKVCFSFARSFRYRVWIPANCRWTCRRILRKRQFRRWATRTSFWTARNAYADEKLVRTLTKRFSGLRTGHAETFNLRKN